MTEIKIQKKRALWPWFLAGLLAAALIGLFLAFNMNRDDAGKETTVYVETDPDEMHENVVAFTDFVRNDSARMTLSHEFTSSALEQMAAAIEATAQRVDHPIDADLQMVRKLASDITKDPYANTHADDIRKASGTLADALVSLQRAKFPNLTSEADAVKMAASGIDPGTLTLNQRQVVRSFLNQSADLLEKMNS